MIGGGISALAAPHEPRTREIGDWINFSNSVASPALLRAQNNTVRGPRVGYE